MYLLVCSMGRPNRICVMGKYEAFDMSVCQRKVTGSLARGNAGKTSLSGFRTRRALLFLDQIKREKGVWWMPRQ
jgi:hypothetical protein